MIDYGTNRCWRCGAPDSPYCPGPMMHPGTYQCDRCGVERNLEYAREAVAKLEELERKLAELGGPAKRVVCGYVRIKLEHDPTPMGTFCWKNQGHAGFHNPQERL